MGKSILVRIGKMIGLDKSIAYSSGARIIQGFTGVASVFFITTFLSGVEQGFYYTFGSILALQVFFELGLTGIMTQYVAHEASHLSLQDDGNYVGDYIYKSRLASLVRFCVKWYGVLSVIVLVSLVIAGFLFFNKYGNDHKGVSWQIPWLLICIGTAIKFFQSPFDSILTGLGKVKEMSKIGFWQQIILPSASWIGLTFGLKLYVVGIGYLLSVLLWQTYVWYTGLGHIIIKLWNIKITERISYMKEIFPYQWRIALSWVSGYFIFQLFNPVLFATEGAVVAGQMGMTLQALNAIQAFSSSWLKTKVPLFSSFIAKMQYQQLDSIFDKTLKEMTSVCLFLLIVFFILIEILGILHIKIGTTLIADRFLGVIPLLIMMIPTYTNQFVSCWATYLRCHKREPFMVQSIVMGILTMCSTVFGGKYYGLYGMTGGYLLLTVLVSYPWSYYIFKTKKREWHHEA